MNSSEHQIAQIGVRLLDVAYMAWRTAESESEAALRAWLDGSARNRDAAWCVYWAALDREEAAAHDLQRLSQLARPFADGLTPTEEWGVD